MAVIAARNNDGNVLVDVHFAAESDLERWERRLPMPASLVVVRFDDSVLMVFSGWRRQWELPGGMRDPGKTARQAAVRELNAPQLVVNEEATAFLWWDPQSSVTELTNPIDAEMARRTSHRQIQ